MSNLHDYLRANVKQANSDRHETFCHSTVKQILKNVFKPYELDQILKKRQGELGSETITEEVPWFPFELRFLPASVGAIDKEGSCSIPNLYNKFTRSTIWKEYKKIIAKRDGADLGVALVFPRARIQGGLILHPVGTSWLGDGDVCLLYAHDGVFYCLQKFSVFLKRWGKHVKGPEGSEG